jgi:Cutinase
LPAQVYTTFHNVPWPGSAVAITWYTAGTTDYVYPFGSTSSPPPGANCQSWYVLGLHGINEGYQSEKHQTRSPELADFAKDLKKDGPIYGPAVEVDVPYPTVFANWRDAAGVFNQGPLWANVKQGVADLQTMVHHYTSTCPGSRISLFGYSEGAWIVNVWELKHPAEAGHIYSAALIGDPCYVDAAGNKGLARIFTPDCGPADDYIVGQTNIQPTNSDCLLLDPVCGAGYLGTPVAQLGGAYACDKLGKYCPHEQYAGVIANLASWMLTDTT